MWLLRATIFWSVRPGMRIFEVSAKTGLGMDAVFEFIEDEVGRMRETVASANTA